MASISICPICCTEYLTSVQWFNYLWCCYRDRLIYVRANLRHSLRMRRDARSTGVDRVVFYAFELLTVLCIAHVMFLILYDFHLHCSTFSALAFWSAIFWSCIFSHSESEQINESHVHTQTCSSNVSRPANDKLFSIFDFTKKQYPASDNKSACKNWQHTRMTKLLGEKTYSTVNSTWQLHANVITGQSSSATVPWRVFSDCNWLD